MTRSRFLSSKHLKYSIPFFLFIVGGSLGLQQFTSLRYKYRAIERVDARAEAQKLGMQVRKPEELTLEAQYEEFKKIDIQNWENKRIPRPKGFEYQSHTSQ